MRGPAVQSIVDRGWRDRRPFLSGRGAGARIVRARPSGRADDRCPIRWPDQPSFRRARTIRAERGRDCRAWRVPRHQGNRIAGARYCSGSRHSRPHRSRQVRRFRRLSLCRAGPGGRACAAPTRVILHEQNAVLGRANRFLARRPTSLALSFAATELVPARHPTVVTGNPVRPAIGALAADQLRSAARSDRGCWFWADRWARGCSATLCRRR